MHELMFQAGVKGMSERTSTYMYIIIVMLHLSVRLYRVSLYIYI